MLEPLISDFADQIIAVGRSANAPVAELLDRVSDITRRGTLAERAAISPLEGLMSGGGSMKGILEGTVQAGASPEGVPQKGVLEHLRQPISPAGGLPGIIDGCIIAAPTKGAFAPGSNTCDYACWYCSKIRRGA